MPSKNTKKKEMIFTVLGPVLGEIIFNKLNMDIDNINSISKNEMLSIVYSMCNYIDSNSNITYMDLDSINLSKIQNIWIDFFEKFKNTYNPKTYVEHNKIILDYRESGIGYYWVDLEKMFCIESMYRMQDCGRVNYGHTTLELRKQTSESNTSHMIIVYENKTGNIRQVKGKSNLKPDESVWVYFYKFLCDTTYIINNYVPTYKSENDLKISDFSNDIQLELSKKYSNIKQLI
jgi:hypothetical protein